MVRWMMVLGVVACAGGSEGESGVAPSVKYGVERIECTEADVRLTFEVPRRAVVEVMDCSVGGPGTDTCTPEDFSRNDETGEVETRCATRNRYHEVRWIAPKWGDE